MAEHKFYILKDKKSIPMNVRLTKKELDELRIARKNLLAILELEELYDQIIESFLEFKSQLYTNSLSLVNDFRRDYIANHELRSKLNRQLFNTLNLSKLYLDKNYRKHRNKDGEITKTTSFVKKMTNDESLEREVDDFLNEIYSKSPEYKLGYALRNLTQHNTLPINTYAVGKEHLQNSKNERIQAKFHLPLAKESLIKSGIKKTILTSFDETIDLHEVMDGYIYAISQVHIKNRKLTESTINSANNAFVSKGKEIEALYGKNYVSMGVFENDERMLYLELDWYEVANYLQKKHAVAINYRNIEHTTYM